MVFPVFELCACDGKGVAVTNLQTPHRVHLLLEPPLGSFTSKKLIMAQKSFHHKVQPEPNFDEFRNLQVPNSQISSKPKYF